MELSFPLGSLSNSSNPKSNYSSNHTPPPASLQNIQIG